MALASELTSVEPLWLPLLSADWLDALPLLLSTTARIMATRATINAAALNNSGRRAFESALVASSLWGDDGNGGEEVVVDAPVIIFN